MKKRNNKVWLIIGIILVIIILFGKTIYLNQDKTKEPLTTEKENQEETETQEDIDNTEEENNLTNNTISNTQTKYEFKNQTGEDVIIEADKLVEATGFSGASNYKFYLKGTVLYFRNISNISNKEELLAYGVKDLYLENKEVTAELNEQGKIVKENNYVTYK